MFEDFIFTGKKGCDDKTIFADFALFFPRENISLYGSLILSSQTGCTASQYVVSAMDIHMVATYQS